MNDYISKASVCEILADIYPTDGEKVVAVKKIDKAYEAIQQLPPAQPERKKGEWVVTSEFEDCRYVKCNQCKVTQVFYYNKSLTNFCPNCGADMRGEQE